MAVKLDSSTNPENDGVIISPGTMLSHLFPDAIPYDEALRRNLAMRAEWAARPEEVEKRRQAAEGSERMRLAKLAAKGKDEGLIGPPDPRKGRLPMTR